MKFRNDKESGRSGLGWTLFAVALALVLVASLGAYLGWLIFGLFLYYVARPISRWLQHRGVSSGVASFVTMAVIVLPFVGLLGAVVVVAVGELSAVRPADIERFARTFFPGFDVETIPTEPARVYETVTELLSDPSIQSVLNQFGAFVGAFATQMYNLFLTLIFVFFLVRDEDAITDWFRRTVTDEGTTYDYLQAVDRGLSSVFFGYTLTIFVIVIASAIIYNLLNFVAPPSMAIPMTVLVAIATGLATLVPLVGRSIVYLLVVLYLGVVAVRTDPTLLWFPLLFFVVMGFAFDNVIRTYVRPYLSGRLFHTGLVMFAYLLGPPIFGWYGIFLGPFVMVVVVQFLWVVVPRLLRERPADDPTTGERAGEERPPDESAEGERAESDESRRDEDPSV
ncbi:AI-2E family transporter [Halomicrococcus sp. NG-SE-24]|uniref:AI-2E family transporter n=1 Tax=Halomicrococcus sp. NG-SE-24 TaxID=3436928 RepID=UPI003D98B26A